MSMHEQVHGLRTRHAHLEQLIDDETHRPMPDQTTLSRLKKEKLRVKEEMEQARPSGGRPGGQIAASA